MWHQKCERAGREALQACLGKRKNEWAGGGRTREELEGVNPTLEEGREKKYADGGKYIQRISGMWHEIY